jgi:amino acid permease
MRKTADFLTKPSARSLTMVERNQSLPGIKLRGAELPTQTKLVRAMGRWDIVGLTINMMVGAGIFGLPSKIFVLTGVWSVLAYLVCAALVTLITLCFAEVGSRFSESGGPYLHARVAFGPFIGFQVGWLLWLARVTASAALCNLLLGYLSFFWPAAAFGWTRALVPAVPLWSPKFEKPTPTVAPRTRRLHRVRQVRHYPLHCVLDVDAKTGIH